MRILFIVDGFVPAHTGGISKSVHTEVLELVSRKHDVVVATRLHDRHTVRREHTEGFLIARHGAPPRGSKLYYGHPLATMALFPRFARKLESEGTFDVAYVHNTFHASALGKSKLPAGKVFSFHAPAATEISLDAGQRKYKGLTRVAHGAVNRVKKIEEQAIAGMDAVFARSEFMRDQLFQSHPKLRGRPVGTIPLMVDTVRFGFARGTEIAKARAGIPVESKVVLTVRRLVARMGLIELIQAFSEVINRHPDALLLIAGSGYLRPELEREIERLELQKYVRLLGFVDEAELPTLFQASDLFILPTTQLEGFGLVTLEAYSCGTPVVATPIGGNMEVVGGFDPQFLTQDSTPSGLAEGIITHLHHAEDPSIRARVRGHCEAHFSRNAVGDALEKVLQDSAVKKK